MALLFVCESACFIPAAFIISSTSIKNSRNYKMATSNMPISFLALLIGETVIIKLKWGQEFRGVLLSFDRDLNIQLGNTTELDNGKTTGNMGESLIPSRNVLYIRGALPEEMTDD